MAHQNIFLILLASCILAVHGLRCWICENAQSDRKCRAEGRSVVCPGGQQMSCQTEVRHHGGWGKGARITKRCKATLACENNQKQNPRPAWIPTQCSPNLRNSVCRCCCSTDHCNKNNPWCIKGSTKCKPISAPEHGTKVCKYAFSETEVGSSCSFKCDSGYFMRGRSFSVCTPKPDHSGAEFNNVPPNCHPAPVNDSKPASPQQTICNSPPPAPATGDSSCVANESGVVCNYTCGGNQFMKGPNVLTCNLGSEGWSGGAPECTDIPSCTDLPEPPLNGIVNCNGNGSLNSICRFTCNAGYDLIGSKTTTCVLDVDVAVWEPSNPECKRLFCPEIEAPANGEMSCTSNSDIGSVCSFRCTEPGYVLQSANVTQLTCTEEALWSHRRPCCSEQCPPVAPMDVVIVLDSSSSVGKTGWEAIQVFVKDIVRLFHISTSSAHFAVLRFNEFVDEQSQIFLDDFPNDKEGLLNAIDSIPYDGKGTYIGNALRHARDVLLKRGNREGVKDMVWVVTDGISADDVDVIAREIREDGAEIYALGIARPDRSDRVDRKQLISIAGDESRVLNATKGLNTALVHFVAQSICENTCT